jgi:L-ascorbate metabolism protein UlaG (beta-lactamase superfamily)
MSPRSGRHPERLGYSGTKIIEYAWWDEHSVNGMTVVAVPGRHFSGHGLFDRNKTSGAMGCCFEKGRIYHTGDTGMTAQFKEIEAVGPL